ncbi:MAG: Gfo/Idh/MocA family oxidoreductase [Chloroflexota bacterium]|nr:Gfo/Idh/MocA family oxidoreductase [Chloroflexota bacterium]MDE2948962.1 Gfo/Idh/MocA family oxidoreductase [Chloroflexota bacterium]
MPKIRIGLIGYGGIGRVHAAAYRAIPFHYGLPADSIEIAGVATTSRETAKRAAQEIGCGFFTDDYRELLTRGDIDAVDICTPNNSHHDIALAAAAGGMHIYCEKPLAMNATEAASMARALRAAGVKSQVTFNFRFFPAVMRARQLMESGFLGRLFSFRGRYHRASYIDSDKPMSWRLQRAVTGGGALFDLGSHILDLLYFVLGEFDSVSGTLDTLIKQRPVAKGSAETAPVDVDDIALLHARTLDGTLGTVEISRMGTGATNDLSFEIFGQEGAIRFDLNEPAWLSVYDARDGAGPLGGQRGFRKIEAVSRYDGQRAPDWTMSPDFMRSHAECQYRFIRAVWDDTATSPSFDDGLHVQKIMAAAERSSETGTWVKLAEM